MLASSEITRQAVLAHTDELMRAAARERRARTPSKTPRADRRRVLRSLTRRLRPA